jgi:hypothetical protein
MLTTSNQIFTLKDWMKMRNWTTINCIEQRRSADKSAKIGPRGNYSMDEEIQQLAVEHM